MSVARAGDGRTRPGDAGLPARWRGRLRLRHNLRAQAKEAGVEDAFDYPGFVPAFIRPQFCEGRGPFRWAALSGDPADIELTDRAVLEALPGRCRAEAGIEMAEARVPSRACRPGSAGWVTAAVQGRSGVQRAAASGRVSAPIVIGRDHLDAGSVASPNRETEAMADGTDAVADWPLLNALVNTAAGASWVSIHHGGGVGIGFSQHAGMVVVADGTPLAAQKLERVLTTDPRWASSATSTPGTSGRSRSPASGASGCRCRGRACGADRVCPERLGGPAPRGRRPSGRCDSSTPYVPARPDERRGHNRSVFTMAGEHGPVSAALDRLVAAAIHEIDMDAHEGEHPRIGGRRDPLHPAGLGRWTTSSTWPRVR